jgi:hypothetical protein
MVMRQTKNNFMGYNSKVSIKIPTKERIPENRPLKLSKLA